MDVVGGFGQYITHIDWVGGLLAAGLAVVVVVLAVRVAGRASDGSVGLGSWLADRTLGALLALRSDVPDTPWVCSTCQSVNPSSASRCYRGCGRRVEVERPQQEGEAEPQDLGPQRGGRSARGG